MTLRKELLMTTLDYAKKVSCSWNSESGDKVLFLYAGATLTCY